MVFRINYVKVVKELTETLLEKYSVESGGLTIDDVDLSGSNKLSNKKERIAFVKSRIRDAMCRKALH